MSYDKKQYKVVKTVDRTHEQLPAALLADTVEEAERIYCEFSPLLNSMSYAYHKNTGLDKSDLFGEGLIGLAKATRDFSPDRGPFTSYAVYRIKDEMNKLVRESKTPVRIPSYIKKANAIICRLKLHLTTDKYSINIDDIPVTAETTFLINKLKGYANRSGISLHELVDRAEYLPQTCELEDHATSEDKVFDLILLEQLKDKMSHNELIVAEGFLDGKTFKLISQENNKSDSWAKNTFDRMCKRLRNIE